MIRPTPRHAPRASVSSTLPISVRRLAAHTGGIISTRELVTLGVDPTARQILRNYGALQAVRQGWHCVSDLPEVFRMAWRFGGPLACVSALSLHVGRARGLDDADIPIAHPLHIALPRNAVGPPPTALLARRWGIPEPIAPVLHWGTAEARSGDRRAVTVETASRQFWRCRAAAEFEQA